MKILELRLKNLNSLYGEWGIDFTHPEYGANGIFALTGPTGAGKSTLLDAVCLALYGATPRLGKITKSTNEIMSRGTGECSAELVFSVQQGIYRCHWGQHRARKKPGGELQAPRHEIASASGEKKVIEHQLKRVARAVEDLTGMDFDRFTRSILLAQGGFDTFLKAEVDQKSKILEQITGTGLYSRISVLVHERNRDEKEQLSKLTAEIGGITLLDVAQEKCLVRELAAKQDQEKELTGRQETIVAAITWLQSIHGLEKELCQLDEQQQLLKQEQQEFKPEQERLAEALKAATIEPMYATLGAARKKHVQIKEALSLAQKQLPDHEAAQSKALVDLEKAIKQTQQIKQQQEKILPLLNQVRLLDQRIADARKSLANEQQEATKITEALQQEQKKLQQEEQKKQQLIQHLETARTYLKEHSQDKQLEKELKLLRMWLDQLNEVSRELERLHKEQQQLAAMAKKLAKGNEQNTARLLVLEKAALKRDEQVQEQQQARKTLLAGRLPRELQAEKEQLLRESAFRQKIVDLEAERNKLLAGCPCPLCGAEHHPYAPYENGAIPELDGVETRIHQLNEQLQALEQLDAVLQKNAEEEAKDKQQVAELQKLAAEKRAETQFAEKQIAEIDKRFHGTQQKQKEQQQRLAGQFEQFAILFDGENGEEALSRLEVRLEQWQQFQQQTQAGEQQQQEIDTSLQLLATVIRERNQALEKKVEQVDGIKATLDELSGQRNVLFGKKNPDVEERQLAARINAYETAEKQARQKQEQAAKQLNQSHSRVLTLEEQLAANSKEVQALEREFDAQLDEQGFGDEKQYQQASLPKQEREHLSSKAQKLSDRGVALEARNNDLAEKLRLEREKQLTDQPVEELELQKNELATHVNQVKEQAAACRHQLSENEKARARVEAQQQNIEQQKKECQLWEQLHGLIGSSDGKKYRNFAQGLTFELMVAHANRQLAKMSDRYLLVRDTKEPLELNVIDNYQAGEVRSIKNLSGGESFLVSLTLALGLSSMSSQKVRVDSLFLDEGFGTLDEETLETALETLAGLQQDGKLIGVISHVAALKERIGTRIEIVPDTGGRSTVNGPGCTAVST